MNERQEIKIGLTDGDDRNELKPSCRVEFDNAPQQVESLAVEWENGDECRYANDPSHEYIYVGEHPHGDGHYVFSETKGITYIANGYLLEPETPQQREERERMEAIKEIEGFVCELSISEITLPLKLAERIVDKTGYRKEAKNAD
jgi:hypothetical protein